MQCAASNCLVPKLFPGVRRFKALPEGRYEAHSVRGEVWAPTLEYSAIDVRDAVCLATMANLANSNCGV